MLGPSQSGARTALPAAHEALVLMVCRGDPARNVRLSLALAMHLKAYLTNEQLARGQF